MAVKHTAEVTITDLSDAYSVTLTNEAASFKATSDTKMGTAGTATTKPQAFMGAEAVACSVTAADCTCSDSANVSVSVNSTGDNATWPLLTITVGANATAGGTVTIPVVIGSGDNAVTIEKVFSYSIALKGAKGDNITVSGTAYAYAKSTSGTTPPSSGWGTSPVAPTTTEFAWTRTTTTFSDGSTAVTYTVGGKVGTQGNPGTNGTSPTVTNTTTQYQKSTSGTAVPTGTWSDTALAPDTSNYVWTKTTITYSDGATAVTYAVAGKVGATGTAGGRWYSGTGITGTSTTATVFSNSGVASAVVGDMYLNTSTYNTYRCTVAGAPSAAKWVYVNNVKGAKGDDPYTLSITSDNGTVLKNNTGQTTLTAHVYQAGAELSTMPSGHSVKWYVDGTLAETDSSLPATFTRTAAQVANKCVVCAKLEG